MRAYAAPGARETLLALQDEHGQSVCLLLWAGWTAARGREPAAALAEEAAGLVRAWETAVIGPLRSARRGLKAIPGLAAEARQALRARVQADELAAEQALLEALEGLAGPPAHAPPAQAPPEGAAALVRAVAAWDRPAPASLLESLARGFPAA